MEDIQPNFNLNQAIIEKPEVIRQEKKLSQQDFAQLLLISPSVYSRILKGERELTLNFVQKVSERTNTKLQDILNLSGNIYNGDQQRGLQNQCYNPTLHINLSEEQFDRLKDILN